MLSVYRTVGVAIVGAGLITVSPVPPSLPDLGVRADAVRLADAEADSGNVAFIAGGCGNPLPSDVHVEENYSRYIEPFFSGYTPQAFFEPNQNYAVVDPVKQLEDTTSIPQDVFLQVNAITKAVDEGHHVVFLGESQSSQAAGDTMQYLAAQGVPSSDVSFVLLGDPPNPNGGLFERLDGLTAPAIGHSFNGSTPDDLYPTTIWTAEYDIFADAPRYPIDILSDINGIVGGVLQHGVYPTATPEQLASAIQLPTTGDTMTTYEMIPTNFLPVLELLDRVPVVGKPLADLLNPILTPLVNLGYGNPDFGWDQGPANVPTEFGLFPQPDMVLKAFQEALAGIPIGIQAATKDLGSVNLSDLSSMLAPTPLTDPSTVIPPMGDPPFPVPGLPIPQPEVALPDLTGIVNNFINGLATSYSVLLPEADLVLSLLGDEPLYDLNLFVEGIKAGDLVEAVGQPIASNMYIDLLFGLIAFREFSSVEDAASGLITKGLDALSSLPQELASNLGIG